MPGMHQSKRKQILVCSHGGWSFYHGWQFGNVTTLKARAQGVVTLQEQHKPVPGTKVCATAPADIHPSGILPRGSGVLFLWKVGNHGSE